MLTWNEFTPFLLFAPFENLSNGIYTLHLWKKCVLSYYAVHHLSLPFPESFQPGSDLNFDVAISPGHTLSNLLFVT